MINYIADKIRRLFRPTCYILGFRLEPTLGDVEIFISDGNSIQKEREKYGSIQDWLLKFVSSHSSNCIAFAISSELDAQDHYQYRSWILPFWRTRVSIPESYRVSVKRLNGLEQDQLYSVIPGEEWLEQLSAISELIALPKKSNAQSSN